MRALKQLVVAGLLALAAFSPAFADLPSSPFGDRNTIQACTAACDTALKTTGLGTINVSATGTGAGLTFSVQGMQADGVTWVTLPAYNEGTQTSTLSALSANGSWIVSAGGYEQVRVHLTAISSGTENIALNGAVGAHALVMTASALPTGASTSALQSSTQGTVAAGTVAANSTLTGCVYNSTVPAATTGQGIATQCGPNGGALPADMPLTGSASSATQITNLSAVDTSGYATAIVQFTSVGAGNNVKFQGSNDNTNWVDQVAYITSNGNQTFQGTVFAVTTSTTYVIPLNQSLRYFRITVSTYSSGTVTAFADFRVAPTNVGTQGVFGSFNPLNTSNIAGAGAIASTGFGVCDDTAPPLVTENQFGPVRMDCTTHAQLVEGQCNQQASVAVTAAATTQVIALSGTTVIRVCSMHLTMATTGTWTVLSGTGSNCGTPLNTVATMNLTAGSPTNIGDGTGVIYRGSAGGELCFTATTGNLNGWVTYGQF